MNEPESMKTKIPKTYKWSGPVLRYKCLICGATGFKTKAAIERHQVKMHTWNAADSPVNDTSRTNPETDSAANRANEKLHEEVSNLRLDKPKSDWTDAMWLAELDSIIVKSDIVPTSSEEFPAGMDRLECVQHLIKLVKQSQEPAVVCEGNKPPLIQMIDDFENAVRNDEMAGSKDDPEAYRQAYRIRRSLFVMQLRMLEMKAQQMEELHHRFLS